MERLVRFLGSEVAATRPEVVIVEMPNYGWPGVVQHPLNNSRRRVLIAAVRFKHRTLALVGHELALLHVVIQALGLSIAILKRRREDVHVAKNTATCMIIPKVVDGPTMLGR